MERQWKYHLGCPKAMFFLHFVWKIINFEIGSQREYPLGNQREYPLGGQRVKVGGQREYRSGRSKGVCGRPKGIPFGRLKTIIFPPFCLEGTQREYIPFGQSKGVPFGRSKGVGGRPKGVPEWEVKGRTGAKGGKYPLGGQMEYPLEGSKTLFFFHFV